MTGIQPTTKHERLEVIDALRGFALFGILFANLYSFIGYNTLTSAEILNLPVADKVVLFFIDWFVEGKFYSIFSILFGLGFALQAYRFQSSNDSFSAFWFRRMIVLCVLGLIHMYLIWNGDILTLYALLGMFLPLFVKCSDKTLLIWILILLTMPLILYGIVYLSSDAPFWGSMRRLSSSLQEQWGLQDRSLLEMRTSNNPKEVAAVNILYAIPRPMSYLMSGRYFHVLGLFLTGLLLSRHWISKIELKSIKTSKVALWFGIIGLICSFGYAMTKLVSGSGYQLNGLGIVQVIVYNVGSTTLALAFAMLFIRIWARGYLQNTFKNLAILGRMALSNYIFQNVTAVLLFFGYGLALMRKVPFASLPFFAFGILLVQWLFSRIWLQKFKQGPLEFLWKKITYKKN